MGNDPVNNTIMCECCNLYEPQCKTCQLNHTHLCIEQVRNKINLSQMPQTNEDLQKDVLNIIKWEPLLNVG